MELKRVYRFPEGWKPDRNERFAVEPTRGNPLGLKDTTKQEGDVLNQPPIDHFIIRHTGTHKEQNFSDRMVQAGLVAGFASIANGELTLKAEPEDLVYKILRGPGYYCCHCGEQLVDANLFVKDPKTGESTEVTRGMVHVDTVHNGEESPDPSNPSGYRRVAGYECELEEGLQQRYSFEEFNRQKMEGDSPPSKAKRKKGRKHG
jgi:hypothetical protein